MVPLAHPIESSVCTNLETSEWLDQMHKSLHFRWLLGSQNITMTQMPMNPQTSLQNGVCYSCQSLLMLRTKANYIFIVFKNINIITNCTIID